MLLQDKAEERKTSCVPPRELSRLQNERCLLKRASGMDAGGGGWLGFVDRGWPEEWALFCLSLPNATLLKAGTDIHVSK
jgi:hypothetical protein